MDRIIISGLKLFARHGVHSEEKINGQNFILDITIDVDISLASESDRVEDTVSYSDVVRTAERAFCSESYNLIEKAAAVTAEAILQDYAGINEITITVKKPEAPVKADFDYMAVQIVRRRCHL